MGEFRVEGLAHPSRFDKPRLGVKNHREDTRVKSLVAGCESAKEPEPAPSRVGSTAASELAGTVWRLIEFQSMDDAIGTSLCRASLPTHDPQNR
jgi:hypothetical protein